MDTLLRFCVFWALLHPITIASQEEANVAIHKVFPANGSCPAPRFSPFNKDFVHLGDYTYHIPARRFLPADSAFFFMPANARLKMHGGDPRYPRELLWLADPYDKNYCWAYEYWGDSLVIWRYDFKKSKKDCFPFDFRGTEVVWGKPGIWISDHKEMLLVDRKTGRIVNRIHNPAPGILMYLQPWGENVVVTQRWLYQREQNRFEPFFPLPAEMEGCRAADKVDVYPEISVSRALDEQHQYRHFLHAPGQKPVALSFNLDSRSFYLAMSFDQQVAWFCSPNKLISVDARTGDSSVYTGVTGDLIKWQQSGRYLGFRSEQGLSFFDKQTCQLRVLDMPFGFQGPRDIASDGQSIFLTFDDHWEILDFFKLGTTFKFSSILDQFQSFEKELDAIQQNLPKDFYSQYNTYLPLFNRYGSFKNPKIETSWWHVNNSLAYTLAMSPDSVMARVIADDKAGRFSPGFACAIAQGLFRYWADKDDLQPALKLLSNPATQACIEWSWQNGEYAIMVLKQTQHRLDSIEKLSLEPDARLYALCSIWAEYGLCKAVFRYNFYNLTKANAYCKELITRFPDSPWADNAAYDTLRYVDKKPSDDDSDFFIPPVTLQQAYQLFQQFLSDYPHSERRPDVLFRMARLISTGVVDENNQPVEKEMASEYLRIIANEYPVFAQNSEAYKQCVAYLQQKSWQNSWSIALETDKNVYASNEPVKMRIRLQNHSQSKQTLTPEFLENWHKGIKLTLSVIREAGCDGLWGDFPLIRDAQVVSSAAVVVAPGGFYEETFELGRQSLNRNHAAGSFGLNVGQTYSYYAEFRLNSQHWLWVPAQKGTQFKVE